MLKIMSVGDGAGDPRLARSLFDAAAFDQYQVAHCGCVGEAIVYLAGHRPDVVLLDLDLQDGNGLDGAKQLLAAAPHVAVVVTAGLDDEALAMQALQAGIQDFLIRDQIQPHSLLRALRYAIERKAREMAQTGAAQAVADRLKRMAQHDALTGLPNRALLIDRIGNAIAVSSRHIGQPALLCLDLDGFSHVNGSLGRAMGDKLLRSVAERLTQCVRGSDTVSWVGGDRFIILLAEIAHPEDAAIAANRVLPALSAAFSIDAHELHISASIGVSLYPSDGGNAETLLENAETAMIQAKKNGRNTYRFLEPAMNFRAVERQSIVEDLRNAVARDELSLHYQPKIDLASGRISSAEALIRWTHPDRGNIPPLKFISIAEDSGLIIPIGKWVLREACRQAKAWSAAGSPLQRIAVNVSAAEFQHEHYLRDVLRILEETEIDPHMLELELTESALMKRAGKAEATLKSLRAEGIGLSIDDFGTGYASLSYLTRFPIDTLKIDRSFIRQITESPAESGIVKAVLSTARSLNLRVVAEGVENLGELEFLQAQHCDEAQGFYFSRPLPAAKFEGLFHAFA